MHAAIHLLLSLLFQQAAVARGPDVVRPIDLLDQRREAVVRVVAMNAAGQPRIGCGLVVDDAGTIATAYELIKDASAARIELSNGTAYDHVTVLGTDGRVALVRTGAQRVRRVKLADSDKLLGVGTLVVVLGGPGGTGRLLAGGRVDATVYGKAAPTAKKPLLQYEITAPLLVTNWGGPAFTAQGEAVGIITPRLATARNDARHGLAPGNAVRELLAEIAKAKPAGRSLSPLSRPEPPGPHGPPKDVFARARTIGVWAPFAPDTLGRALVAGIGTSLPWRVVNDPLEADLVLLVDAVDITIIASHGGGLPGESGRQYEVTASLRDARTGDEVWSSRKGQSRGSSAAPFDQIASRIVSAMKKSFGEVIVPTGGPPKPEAATARLAPALTVEDLPAGFLVLPPADLRKLGLNPDMLSALAGGLGTGVQVAGHSEFIEPRTFQVVYGLVLGPLSPLEAAKMHLELSSPETAAKALGGGFSSARFGTPTLIPGLDVFGDRSLGFTAVSTAGNPGLRIDLVIAIRDTAVEMVVSMYRNGAQPTAGTADIARALDARAVAAFR